MGRYRALLVANARYKEHDRLPDLRAPIFDMSRLRDALINPTSGLFDRDDVRQLPDARAGDILETMEDFFRSADQEDTLLLYYSGHGKTDINNNFFLCAADTKVDRLLSTAVRDEQVNAMMRSSPATTFVVILDCCSSGSWKSAEELPAALSGEGRFVLSSSRPGQNSSDATVLTESSPFTALLVDALETADLDADADGYVHIDEVYRYVAGQLAGQQAQRDYGKSTATVALARRPVQRSASDRDASLVTSIGAAEPATLAVSPEEIRITEADLDELPVTERLYVFNRGGGDLEWVAESDHDWIALETHPEFVRVTLTAGKAGVYRGSIYIRQPRPGAVIRVPVMLSVLSGRHHPVSTSRSRDKPRVAAGSNLKAMQAWIGDLSGDESTGSVLLLSLGIETLGGLSTRLIDRGEHLPTRRSQVFSTASDNQSQVEIHLLQGERDFAADNKTLGRCILAGIPPAPRGVPRLEVTFEIDENGFFDVRAIDQATGREQELSMTASPMISMDDVDNMVRDAEEHADEDRKRREEVEARNRAEQLVLQADRVLEDLADKISESDRTSISALADRVRSKLASPGAQDLDEEMARLLDNLSRVTGAVYQGWSS